MNQEKMKGLGMACEYCGGPSYDRHKAQQGTLLVKIQTHTHTHTHTHIYIYIYIYIYNLLSLSTHTHTNKNLYG